MTTTKPKQEMPAHTHYDSRICFGILYFDTPAKANKAARIVQARGDTYNGGWFHGMACGRATQFDYVDPKLGKLYAVTEA